MLKKRDVVILKKIITEIRKLPHVVGIIQIGSSLYSKDYHDVDLIVFFDKILPPLEIGEINKKYSKYNFYIEGNYINDYKIDPGVKPFIKFFKQLKHKKVLYGRDPFKKINISLDKKDVAYNIRYHYKHNNYLAMT